MKRSAAGRFKKVASYGFSLLLIGAFLGIVNYYLGRRSAPAAAKVVFGRNTVYYLGSATREEATALGQTLAAIGVFHDSGSDVTLRKDPGLTVISFVCGEDAFTSRDALFGYEQVGRRIADSVGGFPITIRLVDQRARDRRDIRVGRAVIGRNDVILYFGGATAQDALAVGEILKAGQYFTDDGATVLLSQEDALTISFVATEQAWTRPESYKFFQNLARQAAAAMGGLPITLRFLDSSLHTQKESQLE